MGKKKLKNSLLCNIGKWAGAFSCPTTWLSQYKCMEIFKTLNSCNFHIYLCIDLKLAEILRNGANYIVLKFCPKNRKFKFLMTSLQTMNSIFFLT